MPNIFVNPKFATILIAGLLIAGSDLAIAQSSEPATKPNPAQKAAWLVNCNSTDNPEVLACQMAQTLTITKTGQRLLTAIIRPQPDNKKKEPALVLALPHGLLLPAGIQLQIDDGEMTTIAIRTSNNDGALTAFSLDKKFVAAMRAGETLKVTMTANDNKPLTLGVSLTGFTAAYKKIN